MLEIKNRSERDRIFRRSRCENSRVRFAIDSCSALGTDTPPRSSRQAVSSAITSEPLSRLQGNALLRLGRPVRRSRPNYLPEHDAKGVAATAWCSAHSAWLGAVSFSECVAVLSSDDLEKAFGGWPRIMESLLQHRHLSSCCDSALLGLKAQIWLGEVGQTIHKYPQEQFKMQNSKFKITPGFASSGQ